VSPPPGVPLVRGVVGLLLLPPLLRPFASVPPFGRRRSFVFLSRPPVGSCVPCFSLPPLRVLAFSLASLPPFALSSFFSPVVPPPSFCALASSPPLGRVPARSLLLCGPLPSLVSRLLAAPRGCRLRVLSASPASVRFLRALPCRVPSCCLSSLFFLWALPTLVRSFCFLSLSVFRLFLSHRFACSCCSRPSLFLFAGRTSCPCRLPRRSGPRVSCVVWRSVAVAFSRGCPFSRR